MNKVERITVEPVASHLPPDHPKVAFGKVGVLLVNLGTPDGHDKRNMRKYLEEFLTDKRVIEWPKALWYPILYGIVLNTRPKKSGHAYASIWNNELDESPLRTFTRAQADKLVGGARRCDRSSSSTGPCATAIRRSPSRLEALQRTGLRADRDLPALSAIFGGDDGDGQRQDVRGADEDALACRRSAPCRPITTIRSTSTRWPARSEKHLAKLDFEPEKVIASYHGIPQSYFARAIPITAIA